MIFRCSTDLIINGIRKSILATVLMAGGLFLCFFLSLSYQSQTYMFETVDKALGGKADSFGIIMIDTMGSVPFLKHEFGGMSGLYSASHITVEPGMAAMPGVVETYKRTHTGQLDRTVDADGIAALAASPMFLKDTGIRLEGGMDWDDVIAQFHLAENLTDREEVLCILGADYDGVLVGSEISVNDWQGNTKIIRVLGRFLKGQETVDRNTIYSEGLHVTTKLDGEIVVLSEDDMAYFFFDTQEELVSRISTWAEQNQVPYSDFFIERYQTYLESRFYETIVLNGYTKKSLCTLIPSFILFLVILQLELFYGERKQLGLLLLNGINSKKVVVILATRNLMILLAALLTSAIGVVKVIPYYFSSDLQMVMEAAFARKVFPITLLTALIMFVVQMTVAFISFRRNSITTLLQD